MLYRFADSASAATPHPHTEVLARLACIRHALRLVDPFGGGPAPDAEDEVITSAWDRADDAKRRQFDVKSGQLVGATSAGLQALLDDRDGQSEPNPEAAQTLVDQIRRELADVAKIILD